MHTLHQKVPQDHSPRTKKYGYAGAEVAQQVEKERAKLTAQQARVEKDISAVKEAMYTRTAELRSQAFFSIWIERGGS